MIKNEIIIDEVINFLNSLLEIDNDAITELFNDRVSCNEKLANHDTVQVRGYDPITNQKTDKYSVGILGILNGLFGIDENGCGGIIMYLDDNKKIKYFKKQGILNE